MEAILGAFGPSIIRKGRVFGSVDSGAVLLVSEDTVSIPFSVCSFLIVNGLAKGQLRGERRKEQIQHLRFMVFSANFKMNVVPRSTISRWF